MDLSAHILTSEYADMIFTLESEVLARQIPDEMERMLAQWKTRWRREELDFYLGLGWSFGAFEAKEGSQHLVGYFLAQPLLFFRGQTQTVWIEHMQFASEVVRDMLIEIAYKVAREKHIQRVLFSEAQGFRAAFARYPQNKFDDSIIELLSTKG